MTFGGNAVVRLLVLLAGIFGAGLLSVPEIGLAQTYPSRTFAAVIAVMERSEHDTLATKTLPCWNVGS
jgi:hypothetical protein